MFGKRKLEIVFLWIIVLLAAGTVAAQKIVDRKQAEIGQQNAVEKSTEHNSKSDASSDVPPESKKKTDKKAKKKESEPSNYLLKRGDREFIWELGTSPFNPSNFAGPKEYDVYGRDLHLSTFRFGRVIGTRGGVTYQYFFGATPLAVFTKNEIRNPAYVSAKETPNVAPTVRKTAWGVGIQPLNFRFMFLPRRRVKPYAQVGAGILLTSCSVPVPRSTPFNLTGDFGGGIQYYTSETRAINFGYKYFHISNGNIGGKINNPGYNANVFYISYSFFHK